MNSKKLIRGVLLGSTIGLLAAVAAVALLRGDRWAGQGNKLPASFALEVSDQWDTDRSRLGYRQTARFDVPATEIRAIVTGPDDSIYIVGDGEVLVFSQDGESQRGVTLAKAARSLAVGGAGHVEPGRLYVAEDTQVEVFAASGKQLEVWPMPAPGCLITAIAVADNDIFLADAVQRVVLRYDTEGRPLGRIGEVADNGRAPGFIVPSASFDLAMDHEGLLLAVNPGARRIEKFTFEGQLVTAWGKSSSDLAGFFGCCNPAHIAVLGDGRIVTSEKGIPRIKRYSASGEFECLVAGPRGLGVSAGAVGDPRDSRNKFIFEVATDSQDRILVLDPVRRQVLVFESNEIATGERT